MKERPLKNNGIEIQNLVKKFEDIIAIDGISFEVKPGELFGLLGPNGAGKTTIINILNGQLKPTRGTAIVSGYDVKKQANKVRELIGVCPQEPAFYSYLTGRENVELFGRLHGMAKEVLGERTDELLNKVGLVEGATRRAGKYSGGMIRRISLVMALINNPDIAYLDEPTVAMDVQSRHATWNFIRELRTQGKTVILTTHYIEEAESLCDRVGIIDQGKLIALDIPKTLMTEYKAKNLEEVFIKITGRKIR
ncbi:MAG: ATP-binding cassette domain-containing protein [Candidatus Heimdallarchaeota archaeon]|nr:MAG: ATP-binding cassette domain-containing protein [Candidatus Heimdallarchaeota archaeon]